MEKRKEQKPSVTKLKKKENLAPRARFELATLRLTAEMIENLSALSGVACEKLGAIFPSLVAPTPAPTRHLQNRGASVATMLTLLVVPFSLKLIRPAPNQHSCSSPSFPITRPHTRIDNKRIASQIRLTRW